MTKIASINLDIRKDNITDNEPIVLRQGDSDVIIEATISNNGYPNIEIDFATFIAKKPDGTIISNDPANVSGNVISYPVSKHLTESVGKIQDAYFMINNQVTTCGFDISIIPSTQLDDTSVNYIPGIENINKFLESTEADWLGRIQQMKAQIDGLNVPDEFKLLMDKALSDAKAQYQPTIDAAEENVENIVADLAAKKLDLTNNSDELNQTITNIKAQVSSITSFLDSIQKQIIDANTSFTAGQQATVSQSITDSQKKLADSIASMQNELESNSKDLKSQSDQVIADLKSSSNAAITDMQNNQSTAMDKVNQNIADTQASIQQIQQSAKNVNDSIQNLQIGGRNLLTGTSGTLQTVTNVTGWADNLPSYTPTVTSVDSDTTYTARVWIAPASHDMSVQLAWKDSSGTWHYDVGNTISAGTSGYSTCTRALKAGSTIQYVIAAFSTSQSIPSTVSYKEAKLERGSIATDWTPAPEDVQTAISNSLNDVNAKVKDLETKIDKLSQGK